MLGERIGNYQIIGGLGNGAMGTIYLAKHVLIERHVAIKVLRPEYSDRADVVQRFFNEARAATTIRTSSIVEVYDFGHHNGHAYIVMEHLQGESLGERMRRLGKLPEADAVAIARKIASALAAAHKAGIVHRDLKPDNIILVPDPTVRGGERVKLLDFGIAKLIGQSQFDVVETTAGTIIGTPAYMAPEQCAGDRTIDQRADLYALGCILFEMLTGRVPFVADSIGELIARHLFAASPSPELPESASSAAVEAVIHRLLAKAPEDRYDSAGALVAALDAILPSPRLALGSGVHALPGRDRTAQSLAGAKKLSKKKTTKPRSWLGVLAPHRLLAAVSGKLSA